MVVVAGAPTLPGVVAGHLLAAMTGVVAATHAGHPAPYAGSAAALRTTRVVVLGRIAGRGALGTGAGAAEPVVAGCLARWGWKCLVG